MYRLYFKRILDLMLSGLSLIGLSPIILIVMVLLKFTGEGDVFYVQKRVGLGNELFDVYKFITMRRGSENVDNPDLQNDTRVFPLGRILRATKINELPQLFNVFNDMFW